MLSYGVPIFVSNLLVGLAARTFKKRTLNPTEADRSVWTDTPADREKKLRVIV